MAWSQKDIDLEFAFCHRNFEQMRTLTSQGVNINKVIILEEVLELVRERENHTVIFLVELGFDFKQENYITCLLAGLRNNFELVKFFMSKGAPFNRTGYSFHQYVKPLQKKYFRKWRKVVFRNFIRKVIVPLYYSPGFPGIL